VFDEAKGMADEVASEEAREGAASETPARSEARSNEPLPLLGVSRAPELQNVSLWVALKMWLRRTPKRKQVNLPRPPRSVLAARTPTIVEPEDERSERRRRR
jgi:hypothetical protein